MELFSTYGVFNERELESRYEVGLEQYVMTVNVEANLTAEIARTTILPAALRYQTELAQNVAALKAAGVEADTCDARGGLRPGRRAPRRPRRPRARRRRRPRATRASAEATYVRDAVIPAMAAVREAADALEGVVADDLWPLPTYQEMLYIL